ncbi:MAG: PadR family transcriptional regulator [Brevefilum sp.]|nr:PadR family transcriptional regulator [Brevefilum sp.]MDT8381483.1 PadR family transcriptional regulator [Brevefilum sp.]MDW7755051.1 PadR family transcriptional regulator [Brevefilum sp.]
MRRPVPDEVILGLLRYKPAHGYDLLESFRSPNQLGRMWSLSTSQLYAVLKRLEEAGEITGEQVNSEDAPAKVVYTVTCKGLSKLNNWLYDPEPSASIHRIRVLFLSRLYIAELLKVETEKIINNQKKACVSQLKVLLDEREKTSNTFENLAIDFIVGQLEAAITWLDQIRIQPSTVKESE